ncbi:hypothetical protein DL96DRAFT_1718214 [Flagelloscypha sp. PMI_526]|nr:hypothetical protein DL96DRAFT_1718214 [Flagelloscypha sp. PMI_526]
MSQVIVAVILMSRVYAIWSRNRKILLTFCILFASGIGIVSWSMATSPHSDQSAEPKVSCLHPGVSKEVAIHLAIDWEFMFLCDLVVFVLTLVKSYQGMKYVSGLEIIGYIPLLSVMMRDGTLYFLSVEFLLFLYAVEKKLTDHGTRAIAVVNAANVGVFYLSSSQLRGSMSTFASSISVTLASRIMLNLHASLAKTMPTIDTELMQTDIRFRTSISEDENREG